MKPGPLVAADAAASGLAATAPAPVDALRHYRMVADLLDSLHLGLCLFDTEDRALLWNRTFLRLFPEHAGHVRVGEPYADNLRRFYAVRLAASERASVECRIAEGIARHRAQTHPFVFEHRGQWVRVASQRLPGIGRIRIWSPIAPPDRNATAPADPDGLLAEVMPFTAEDGDGVVRMDAQGQVTAANTRFGRFFGLAKPEDAIGATLAALYAAALASARKAGAEGGEDLRPWQQTLADAQRFAGAPFELPLPDGRWLRVLHQHMHDNTVVATFADITSMKALQAELLRAREAAEGANHAKDEFLATISHELRTPMNGILGMLDMLDDGRLAPDQAERLRVARDSAEALRGLLDDILTFSRLQGGHEAAEQVPASPAELLGGSVRLMQARAAQKGLTLRWSLDGAIPDTVLCDPARLRQVLLNLIGNAVKFTEAGRITVAAQRGAALPDGGFLLEVEVTDTGIGIPARALGAIFDPFVQADSGISRRFGGTGLGLSICRKLVGLMGGEISVTSTERHGSCFRFSVACGRADASVLPVTLAPCAADLPALPRLRVLVVDDHPVNRDVARLHLQRLGMEVETVAGGAEAIAACQQPFGMILLDLQMPGIDGFETARRLRRSGLPGAAAPILALTAHAGDDHRRRAREAGMQGYVTKPIRLEALARAMAAALDASTAAEPAPPVAATGELLQACFVEDLTRRVSPTAWERVLRDFEQHARGAVGGLGLLSPGSKARRDIVHGLKGVAWNLGARQLGDLLQAMEAQPDDALPGHLPELNRVLEATIAALREVPLAR